MWKEILKAPYPNRVVGNRKARGGRRIKEGTGKYGLFRYDEINEKLGYSGIREEIDEAYEKEIEKVTKKNIRESKKKLGDKYSSEMNNYIKRRVRDKLTEQKKTNLYATTYGKDANRPNKTITSEQEQELIGRYGKEAYSKLPAGAKPYSNWFVGFRKLGYDPNNEEELQKLMARIKGVGNRRFVEWEEKRQEERKEKIAEFLATVSLSGWENYSSLADKYNKEGPLSGKGSRKAESAKILTANVEGKPIASIALLELNDGTIWVHEIKVDNKYTRKGIASLLMKKLIDSYGDKEITGLVIPGGKMSRGDLVRFYEKYGFKTKLVMQTDGKPGIEVKRG